MKEDSKQDEQLTNFISLVPKHLRKFVKHGIFILPTDSIIDNYQAKKVEYLQKIKNTKDTSVNNLHKYTSVNPVAIEDVNKFNEKIRYVLDKYYSQYLKQYEFKNKLPELFTSFAISYDKGHQGLKLHTDDSTYTVNICLQTSAQGNQVVFNEIVNVDPIQDYALIHSGKIPHHTNELTQGERVNVVFWFK